MTIILRLQGLDVKAGTEDIRAFFECLHIPDGGVYIVGGSLGEAFIAFDTEREAQLAMRHTGRFLKGSKVTLHVSSMAEMEHKLRLLLEKKKKKSTQDRKPQPHPDGNLAVSNVQPADTSPSSRWPLDLDTANLPLENAQPVYPTAANVQTPNGQSIDSNTAFLLGVYTVLQGLESSRQREIKNADPRLCLPTADRTAVVSGAERTPEQTLNSSPGYVRLFGLPASTTKEDISHFFSGLTVQEAIVNVKWGVNSVCLVKFANMQDAHVALRFNNQSLGDSCVEVRKASEKMWTSALQECEIACDVGLGLKPQQNPTKEHRRHKQKSITSLHTKRPSVRLPSKPPKTPKLASSSKPPSPIMEYIVMVRNLPKSITKTEIKELFGCRNILHKNVLHLLDKKGNRTDTAFLIFNHTEDYDYAMNLTGCHVGSDAIEVSSITKEVMWEKMTKYHHKSHKAFLKTDPRKKSNRKQKPGSFKSLEVLSSKNTDPMPQTCLYVRNMPADVQKSQIKGLFCNYKLGIKNITLLHDSNGSSTGEAVVQFKSEKLAAFAHRIHGNVFLGSKVLLTRINVKQMQDILAENV
ncbi:RNA binding motif protein 12Ba [Mugil cephalus]|uniref:RNA binding motif protein 12Ba n=1 Tax=Mugil cephalus TaxID=48193 RepID=UPI001FB629E8|nr:RNA binding motif protein 12Ba [Mugil cephalus]XP_047454707.1 RNA binding motif protein 12Ba [Mugil cephalus]